MNYAGDTYTQGIAAGDLNGDGHPDIVATNTTDNTISVFMNNGNGTFRSAGDVCRRFGPYAVALGDFMGNGRQDIAVADTFVPVYPILMNNGNGTFAAAVNYAVGGAITVSRSAT